MSVNTANTVQDKATLNITITGKPDGPRFELFINGHRVLLTLTSFKYLLFLIAGLVLKENPSGWVDKWTIEPQGDNHARYLYRMKSEIKNGLGEYADIWQNVYRNDHAGRYRLFGLGDLETFIFDFNWDALSQIQDHDLVQLFARIRAKVGSGK